MRVISNLELQIIDRICNGHTHISTLLIDHIPNLILDIDRKQEKVTLKFKDTDIVKDAIDQTEKIIYIINFLIYLENEGYAISGHLTPEQTIYGEFSMQKDRKDDSQNKYSSWNFPDKRIEQLIFDYSDRIIIPTYQLKEFKNRGYKTKEDKRHNQMLWTSSIAIIISLFLGIWSIYQNISNNNPTRQQINRIIKDFEKKEMLKDIPTKQQVDSLINVMKNNYYKIKH